MHTEFRPECLKGRDRSEDLGIEEKILFGMYLKEIR
jgi:hypothetical protein